MNLLTAVLLGLIQGLTEFLPISSTAHLTIAGKFLGLIDPAHPEAWTEFIAVIQLGTVAAVIVYFFKDVLGMIGSLLGDLRSNGSGKGPAVYGKQSILGLNILIGTFPVGFFGLSLQRLIEGSLTKNIVVIGIDLILLALLLWLAERVAGHVRGIDSVRWSDALVIGIAQACALIPGSSRSGTTITAGLFLGLTREAAARFSFLLSIPAVLASGVYEMTKIHSGVFELGVTNLLVSTLVAGLTGYAAIAWLLRFLARNTTMVFVWYRIALGLFLIALLILGHFQL